MSDIEETKPIDVLACRVWNGSHWHYPHIETMIAELARLRLENATMRRALEAYQISLSENQ